MNLKKRRKKMLSIAFALLGAWILNCFGFGQVVITGMKEVFGVEIGMTSYYFIFAMIGALKSILNKLHPTDWEKLESKIEKL